jgi:hypothetical protein
MDGLASDVDHADLPDVLCAFISAQTNKVDPVFVGWIYIYASVTTLYYAPSNLAGPHGMHCNTIQSTDLWYGQYERRNVVLAQLNNRDDVMGGLRPARILCFMLFTHG